MVKSFMKLLPFMQYELCDHCGIGSKGFSHRAMLADGVALS